MGIGWLKPGSKSPEEIEGEAEQRVQDAADKLQEPLLPSVATIYSSHLFDSGLADEWLGTAEKFAKLFRNELYFLNEGVADLDFVRECVRRSFGISTIIPYGPEGEKRCFYTSEQIEKIAVDLVELGYVLPRKA